MKSPLSQLSRFVPSLPSPRRHSKNANLQERTRLACIVSISPPTLPPQGSISADTPSVLSVSWAEFPPWHLSVSFTPALMTKTTLGRGATMLIRAGAWCPSSWHICSCSRIRTWTELGAFPWCPSLHKTSHQSEASSLPPGRLGLL